MNSWPELRSGGLKIRLPSQHMSALGVLKDYTNVLMLASFWASFAAGVSSLAHESFSPSSITYAVLVKTKRARRRADVLLRLEFQKMDTLRRSVRKVSTERSMG